MTVKELKELPKNKIRSIKVKTGLLGSACMMKVFYNLDNTICIVTRKGILEYIGDAQRAQIYGKKGIHYKEYKTISGAVKYINTNNQPNQQQ